LGRTDDAAKVARAIRARGAALPALSLCVLPALEGSIAVVQGHVHVAKALAAQALSVVDGPAVPGTTFGLLPARLCRGVCLVDLAEPDAAREDLDRVLAESRHDGVLGYEVLALAAMARLEWSRGDALLSVELVRQARQALFGRSPRSPLVHHLSSVESLARISLGDAARAERLIAGLPHRPSTSLLAVRLAQLRRPGSGTSRLERLVAGDPRSRAEQLLLTASAIAVHQPSRAIPWLLQATELAQASGLLTLLVGASDVVLDLAGAEARRSADDTLARMVTAATRGPARVRTETHLSAGDRELLALLPGRDPNDAIATRLSVSVNTVKTRLRRLYAKLEVGSRDEAVRVARERGLID
jgi:LuxR family transcriptional regulator, maltose regulon positive regulatory protein